MMPTNSIPVKFFLFFFKILKVILWGNWPLAVFPYNRCCQELLSYKDIFVFFATENRQLLGELNGIDTLLQCLSVSLFNYAILRTFSMFTLPHLNMRGVGRIQDSYSITKRRTRVCINVENSSSSSRNIFWENIYHQRKTTSLVFY